jgi:hypothetical protein
MPPPIVAPPSSHPSDPAAAGGNRPTVDGSGWGVLCFPLITNKSLSYHGRRYLVMHMWETNATLTAHLGVDLVLPGVDRLPAST